MQVRNPLSSKLKRKQFCNCNSEQEIEGHCNRDLRSVRREVVLFVDADSSTGDINTVD